MYQMKIKQAVRLVVLLSITGLTILPASVAWAVDNPNGPVLPPQCDSIQSARRN